MLLHASLPGMVHSPGSRFLASSGLCAMMSGGGPGCMVYILDVSPHRENNVVGAEPWGHNKVPSALSTAKRLNSWIIIQPHQPPLQTSAIMTDSDPKTPQDLSDFAETLMKSLQDRFQGMSDQLTQRMEEIGSKIDELQKDVSDLMTQAGIENPDDVVH